MTVVLVRYPCDQTDNAPGQTMQRLSLALLQTI